MENGLIALATSYIEQTLPNCFSLFMYELYELNQDAVFLKLKHRGVRLTFINIFGFQLYCEYPRCCTGTGYRSALPEWIKGSYCQVPPFSSWEKDNAGSTVLVSLSGIQLNERLSICWNYHKHLWLIWDSTWDLVVSDSVFSTIGLSVSRQETTGTT